MSSGPNLKRISNTDKGSSLGNLLENPFVFARMFFTFGMMLITFECLFYNKLNLLIKELGLPVFLWPSEIWFICVGGLLFMFHVKNRGMRLQIKDSKPIIVVVLVFLIALIHGLLRQNHFVLSEFREIGFGAFALPIVILLSPYYDLNKGYKYFYIFFTSISTLFFLIAILESKRLSVSSSLLSNAFTLFLFFALPFFILSNSFRYKRTLLSLFILSIAILVNFSKLSIANFLFTLTVSLLCFIYISPKAGFLKLSKMKIILAFKILSLLFSCLFMLFLYDRATDGIIQKAVLMNFLKLRPSAEGELYFGDSSGGRLAIWKESLNLWLERPLTGHGLGKTVKVYSAGWVEKSQLHNYFLQMLQNIGLIGMLIVVSCFGYWLMRIFTKIKMTYHIKEKIVMYSLSIFIMTVLFNGLYGHSLSYPPISILFWVCIGFLSSFRLKSFGINHES